MDLPMFEDINRYTNYSEMKYDLDIFEEYIEKGYNKVVRYFMHGSPGRLNL